MGIKHGKLPSTELTAKRSFEIFTTVSFSPFDLSGLALLVKKTRLSEQGQLIRLSAPTKIDVRLEIRDWHAVESNIVGRTFGVHSWLF